MKNTVESYAANNGVLFGTNGYSFSRVSLAGLTQDATGAIDGITEVYYNATGGLSAWTQLQSNLIAAGFQDAGFDPLHGVYDHSFRQGTNTWSLQVSYEAATGNIQVDIDAHNPQGNFWAKIGHSLDVLGHMLSGNDTNYHDVANRLSLQNNSCP